MSEEFSVVCPNWSAFYQTIDIRICKKMLRHKILIICLGDLFATAFQGSTLTAFEIGNDGDLKRVANLKWDEKVTDLVAR